MIGKIIIASIGVISGVAIGFINANNYRNFPKFSEIIDVKAIQTKKIYWIETKTKKCIGDCRDSYSSSPRGSSNWGGGK